MPYKNIIKKENIDIIFTNLANQYKEAFETPKEDFEYLFKRDF